MNTTTKKCTKCFIEKSTNDFPIDKRHSSGFYSWCKECVRKKSSKWCKENPEKSRAKSLKWHNENSEKHKIMISKWRDENRTRYLERMKEWRKNHPLRNYPKRKLSHRMATSISKSIKGNKNGNSWERLVGYSLNDLTNHLERQFQPGMTWENHGEWHIDHKIPINVFNFTTPEDLDFKRCWALKNLQPLWAKDNLIKFMKIDKPFQPCLALKMVSDTGQNTRHGSGNNGYRFTS